MPDSLTLSDFPPAARLADIFPATAQNLLDYTGAERCCICYLNEEADELEWLILESKCPPLVKAGHRIPVEQSAIAGIIRTRQIAVFEDFTRDTSPDLSWLAAEGYKSACILPLVWKGQAIAALSLWGIKPSLFSIDLAHSVTNLASYLAAYVSVELEIKSDREEIKRLLLVNQLGQEIRSSLDPQSVMRLAANGIGPLMKASRCVIALCNLATGEAFPSAEWCSLGVPSLTDQPIPISGSPFLLDLINQRTTQIAVDIEQEPRLATKLDTLRAYAVRSILTTPLIVDGQVIGLVSLNQCDRVRRWTLKDISLAEEVAAQLAVAIGQARMYEAAQRRAEREAIANRITTKIRDSLDLDQIERSAVTELGTYFGVDSCKILEPGSDEARLKTIAAYYRHENELRMDELDTSPFRHLVDELLRGGHVIVNDLAEDERTLDIYQDVFRPLRLRSCLIVPIRQSDKLLGAMTFTMSDIPRQWTQDEVMLARSVADQLAIAICQARLYSETREALARESSLREQLLQSEKMSAIGQLVSGVAHELNNPLTSVVGFSELILSETSLPPMVKHFAENIAQQGARAAKIVQNLLTFARKRKTQKALTNINELVEKTLELRSYEHKVNNIEVITELSPTLPYVLCDPSQIQQVLLNLIINAEQAMLEANNRGCLTISSMSVNGKVRVSVIDDGPGIPPEVLPRIFDPFYTTKEVGKGTGLGLSICYGILTEHGGNIWAESGRGGVLILELPVEAKEADVKPLSQQLPRPRVSGKRILVVDDEPSVTRVIRVMLEADGHSVDEVETVDSAIERLHNHSYDLVISDVKMPGKSGKELYRYIKQRPQFTSKILFMTGDTASNSTGEFLADSGVHYIPKPFSSEQLRHSICQVFL